MVFFLLFFVCAVQDLGCVRMRVWCRSPDHLARGRVPAEPQFEVCGDESRADGHLDRARAVHLPVDGGQRVVGRASAFEGKLAALHLDASQSGSNELNIDGVIASLARLGALGDGFDERFALVDAQASLELVIIDGGGVGGVRVDVAAQAVGGEIQRQNKPIGRKPKIGVGRMRDDARRSQ